LGRLHKTFATFLLFLMVAPALGARADSFTTAASALPTGRASTSAVWDGQRAYVFGGNDGTYLDQIVQYDPVTGTVATMGATLPTPAAGTSAVWTGGDAYVFGGDKGGLLPLTDQILRYRPSLDMVTVMPSVLPAAVDSTGAAWDGSNTYIFGGVTALGYSNKIVRYDPGSGAVTTMGATLPTPRYGVAAAWDGANVYLFGGRETSTSYSSQIVRYTPATDTITVMSATLPSGRQGAAAVWDGSNVYVFGGDCGQSCPSVLRRDDVVRYNPSTNTVTTMSAKLPTARGVMPAVWAFGKAHVFGGLPCCGLDLSEILKYSLAPGAPQSPAATAGPGGGQISLNWSPPPANSYSSVITGYKVYRSATSGGSYALLATLGNVLSYIDAGLPAGATRYYKVLAYNPDGDGSLSNETSATAFTVPSAPQNLLAKPGLDQTTLTWQSPATNGGSPVTDYAVYRRSFLLSPYSLIGYTGGSVTFVDLGCMVGNLCTYRVAAINAAGQGPFSNEALAPGTAV
jgi:N-acetylneuraminic acid mutarotase